MSSISSVPGHPMRLRSDGNFSVNINNKNKNIHTDLLLGKMLPLVTILPMIFAIQTKPGSG